MSKEYILIVEDDAILALSLQATISEWGYQPLIASSGERALEIATGKGIILVLLDIHLCGKLDGIESAERIQSLIPAPIVFLTAHADEVLFQRAKRVGPYGYMLKPLRDDELRATIELALYKSKRDRQLKANGDHLEKLVVQRTLQLKKTNADLEKVNTTLRVLLTRKDDEKKRLEESLVGNIKYLLKPCLEELRKTDLSSKQVDCVRQIEVHLSQIASSFVRSLSSRFTTLTPTEVRIAKMIKDGLGTRAISEALNLSPNTVRTHRESIRAKLSIKNKKFNLRSYLSSLD